MGNVKSEVSIENENLFRALVCSPIAVLLVILTANSIQTSGFTLLNVILIAVASYFTLCAIAYAAFYTNEYFADMPDNDNLFNTLMYGTLAIIVTSFTVSSVLSSGSILFQVVFICLALYLTLSALAYAAFYTNDCMVSDEEH